MRSIKCVIVLAALAALLGGSAVQAATTIAYWQFNEGTSGYIPNTGNPLLDSSGNGLTGNSRAANNAQWGQGLNYATDPTDGAMYTPSYSSYGVLMKHSTDYNMMLGDLQSYRFDLDVKPGDWYSGIRLFQYRQDTSANATSGYRLMVYGVSSGGETHGGYLKFFMWDNNKVYWAAQSDPTKVYLPDYRTNPGTWYHLAVEVHPMADQNQTYVQFYIGGVDAGKVAYGDVSGTFPGWAQADMNNDLTDLFAIGSSQGSPGYNYALGKSNYDNFMISNITGGTPVYLPGDADRNGTVDGADLNTVLSNYNQSFTVDPWSMGDFDGNGTVDGADLNTVLSNYNQHLAAAGAPGAPEPSTLLLAAAGLVGLLGYGWRKRK
jgi:hypothetical protein